MALAGWMSSALNCARPACGSLTITTTVEFGKFPGDDRCKLDILMESTNPENLKAELDLAWVYVGGADPAAYIRKYKGRCPDGPRQRCGSGQERPEGSSSSHWGRAS